MNEMKKLLKAGVLAGCLVGAALTTDALAQQVIDDGLMHSPSRLVVDSHDDSTQDLGWVRDDLAIRARAIGINSDSLASLEGGDAVELALFDDSVYRGVVDLSDDKTLGGWLEDADGRIVGGSFLFAVHDDAVAGNVRVPGVGVYRIRGTRDGAAFVELLRDDSFGTCDGGVVPDDLPNARHDAGAFIEQGVAPAGDDGSVIDVLVAYTTEAKNSAGGTAQMEARIDLAIAASNRAYANSMIGFEIHLVHSYEVDYDENTSAYGAHLQAFTNTNGVMDEIHELRDTYGADMVSLLVNDRRSCGNAWLMRTNSNSFQGSAYSVVTWTCAVGNMSFAHELGHNMGACHAVGDPCSGGLYSYSYGHRFVGNSGSSWRSVMAYSPGSRIEYFSNPDVLFDGQATGVLNVSQNNLTLIRTGPTVANFRSSAPECRADFSGEGDLNFFDISLFIAFYLGEAEQADFTEDGVWNFFDVSAFMLAFAAGCP